jgi:hypothetical protein
MLAVRYASVASQTTFDRSLWTIVLTIAVAFVVFSFARGPLTGSDDSATTLAHPLTLWVAGGEAAGETEALAQQAAACWQLGGRQATVGVLPGGSVEAVGDFLYRARGAPDDLLLLTSGTLSEIAYEALRPPGSPARARAQDAARRLLEATPVAVLGVDSMSLAVQSSSSIHTTAQLLALLHSRPFRPLLGVAAEAWLEGSLAMLAQSAGVEGEMPFSAYRSSREAVASLDAGEAEAIVAPHSALVASLRQGTLRQLSWPDTSRVGSRGWVAVLAPSGLNAGAVSALRRQAAKLCHGGWRERVRQDGLSPARASPASLRDLIHGGLTEAGHMQELASRLVRNY